ncbi:hypothetical protein HCUR_00767 [Holospora curviuscula]|uniref:Uncharacterized protein n=1 Tax=Holospora curviuscula TaxID=1082868 RepID=A0A2S5R972_9PROT|nr:hypothetical protein HCUR_00767 [Holospora curviuscula]
MALYLLYFFGKLFVFLHCLLHPYNVQALLFTYCAMSSRFLFYRLPSLLNHSFLIDILYAHPLLCLIIFQTVLRLFHNYCLFLYRVLLLTFPVWALGFRNISFNLQWDMQTSS